MLASKWIRIILIALLALAALLLIRLHQASDQPAPIYKGKRACSEQQSECQKLCNQKSSNVSGCFRDCAHRFQQCLASGCWIGGDFRYCGLEKR
jgi:hypothetical protein